MPDLVLGPLVRYVGEREATVWVETDGPCEVEVLGHTANTFHVEDHHYAVVCIDDLEPGSVTEYEVRLDGEQVWPDPEFADYPPSVIRTLEPRHGMKLVFGSCRTSYPHRPPFTLSKDDSDQGRERDALHALALRLRQLPQDEWPRMLILLGDQVYADEVSPATLEWIRSRRDTRKPPGEEVADFEEYTHLYREAWRDPAIRWLLSTVPSAMIFDDHDVHDDWNTSKAWLEEFRRKPWWNERIVGALMSYWIYQHIGNLAPSTLKKDEHFKRVHEQDDAGPMLREFAYDADRKTETTQWSFCRDLGRARLIVMDSRAGRAHRNGERAMVDEAEWEFIKTHATGDCDHLLLGTSLPFLLGRGMHYLEAWNEAVCVGAWGRRWERPGEWLRQYLDLEHWGAFQKSFHALAKLLREVGSGERGTPPASIVVLSGDVHHAYLADVAFPKEANVKSHVYQAVCSPFRNPLDYHERKAVIFGTSTRAELLMRPLARAAGVKEPEIRWRIAQQPTFDNQIATLELDGRGALLRIEKTTPGGHEHPDLHVTLERRLA